MKEGETLSEHGTGLEQRSKHPLQDAILPVNFHCHTGGDGLWVYSTHATLVHCTMLKIAYVNNENDNDEPLKEGETPTFGELRIRFDTKTWNRRKHGLIYTDKTFEVELRDALVKLGFTRLAAKDVGYSEGGMQGDDYVSCDVGGVFLAEAGPIFARKQQPEQARSL